MTVWNCPCHFHVLEARALMTQGWHSLLPPRKERQGDLLLPWAYLLVQSCASLCFGWKGSDADMVCSMTTPLSTFAYTKAIPTIVCFEAYVTVARPSGGTSLENNGSCAEKDTHSEKRKDAWWSLEKTRNLKSRLKKQTNKNLQQFSVYRSTRETPKDVLRTAARLTSAGWWQECFRAVTSHRPQGDHHGLPLTSERCLLTPGYSRLSWKWWEH